MEVIDTLYAILSVLVGLGILGGLHLLGRVVNGREIMVSFSKYESNAERIWSCYQFLGTLLFHNERLLETVEKLKGRSRSRNPRPSEACRV
ncbi:hypothetical protein HanXRQr2_Chr16g0728731 [Helianthus annuus]|uniref:Uncharacterized protein n=1 Tax=Helianthus annuus TaxID=4232 RepID=A0A9K3GXA2_HELAN|nr:hypothetical protein HanXRQr2_Chr16g0728731 [Helianthus annuus]KAJ0819657.1 hypothetical protein HanPSC8_Chr16g0698571 [Helianthus annuus]